MWYMVTTFVNHLYFEGRLICSVVGFYIQSCIYLFTKAAYLYVTRDGLGRTSWYEASVIFPIFNNIPKNENSRNSVRFESVVLQTNVRTEHGLLVDFRNSFANALRSAFTVRKKFWVSCLEVIRGGLHDQDAETLCSKNTGMLIGWTTISF